MKVKDIMTGDPRSLHTGHDGGRGGAPMWEGDCGILPVVDDGELVAFHRPGHVHRARDPQRARRQVAGGAVATRTVVTCTPEYNVQTALMSMKNARVRRLPVVGFGNTVVGVLSLNDILRTATTSKSERGGRCATSYSVPTITWCHRSLRLSFAQLTKRNGSKAQVPAHGCGGEYD